ncbi:MAG: carbon starvation protein A [Chloroflexi bacterium]|nr:carbon starvation protein A [Chloroflexota bacterium]
MNTLLAVIIGAATVYLGYTFYARRIDRNVLQPDARRATPARLYMDGVDFIPTSRNVLYGYHFKSIAAAGPIVGAITAAALWGWFPALLWLMFGVFFIGWASDYSAIMVSVRILLLFIFFYLLLVAGAFVNLIAQVLAQPHVPLGIIMLAVMGALAGQMLYRWRLDLIAVTLITVGVTLAAILLGGTVGGPVEGFFKGFNAGLNTLTAGQPVTTVLDPTLPADRQNVPLMPSFMFWLFGTFVFCYLGAALPIWRFAQPVNYIGFWITALTIFFGGLGAAIAFVIRPDLASFKLPAYVDFLGPESVRAAGAFQPLWPMLFVTIACGAISGWHALFGSVGTARQIENETDVLPVGGGAMFSEFTLGLLSLMAVAIAIPGPAVARFAEGVGSFLSVFGLPAEYGRAIAFAAFVVIVITVVQLVFRVMRVTLAEGLGDRMPAFRNIHVGIIISIALAFLLVVTGVWIYLWQLFGASNQLMASLSLLIVTVWLIATRRNPLYAGIPMLFMYITTNAAALVTAYNLWNTVFLRNLGVPGRELAVVGSGLMIFVALLLVGAAVLIGIDGYRAVQRYRAAPGPQPAPAPTS